MKSLVAIMAITLGISALASGGSIRHAEDYSTQFILNEAVMLADAETELVNIFVPPSQNPKVQRTPHQQKCTFIKKDAAGKKAIPLGKNTMLTVSNVTLNKVKPAVGVNVKNKSKFPGVKKSYTFEFEGNVGRYIEMRCDLILAVNIPAGAQKWQIDSMLRAATKLVRNKKFSLERMISNMNDPKLGVTKLRGQSGQYSKKQLKDSSNILVIEGLETSGSQK